MKQTTLSELMIVSVAYSGLAEQLVRQNDQEVRRSCSQEPEIAEGVAKREFGG